MQIEATYTVAVRALCEFTAKAGDLDLRFTPSPTAQEGVAGHAVVTGRRPAGYETEVSLQGRHGSLLVRGRADGYDPAANLLEEIKTYRGRLDSMPARHRHLHWAQLRVYGHLLCEARGLKEVHLALVYFDIAKHTETLVRATASAAELAAQFAELCERFVAWAASEQAHRQARDKALLSLAFPHPAFRPGQRAPVRDDFQSQRQPPLRAGAGAHRHRQDGGFAVPRAESGARPGHRQAVLPVRQNAGTPARARCAGDHRRQAGQQGAAPARTRTGGARQGLRASRQGLPWRRLPTGQRLL